MVKIIADSSTLYTREEGKKAGLEAIPLCVSIGENHYRDLTVDMDSFYGQIDEGGIPTSSQPPVGEVMEAYEEYKGSKIINLTLADGLSGTYQTACGAREMADNKEDIVVINTMTLCGPHRYMAEQAVRLSKEGKSQEEIVAYIEEKKKTTESFLIPQDFAFLKRGGRLTAFAAAIGSALHLKPVMTLTEDCKKLDKFAMGRSFALAIKAIIKQMKKTGVDGSYKVYISHGRALKDAETARDLIAKEFEKLEIEILELSAAFVTQGGPRCVAVQYIKK